MKSLVIHIGPPKCGSSSIQKFFEVNKDPCTTKTKFIMLEVKEIERLGSSNEPDNATFTDRIAKGLEQNDTMIISHEYLFLVPKAIKNICDLLASKVSKIIIIGYSRRSSDFIISAYHQWVFRNLERNKRINEVMHQHNLDPLHFYGFERSLIASILENFSHRSPPVMDWWSSYMQIEQLVPSHNVTIKAGIIPNKGSSVSLIEDFCKKADLTLKAKYYKVDIRTNPQFGSHLTESFNNAVDSGSNVPSLHEDNRVLHEISKVIDTNIDMNRTIVKILKEYVDNYFYESNVSFCRKYDLDENYFNTSNIHSKDEVVDMIRHEMRDRIENHTMLKNYKEMTGAIAATIFSYYKNNRNVVEPNLSNNSTDLFEKLKRVIQRTWHG